MRLLLGVIIGTLAGTLTCIGQVKDYMRAFPPAEKGMVRHVWNPPVENNESNLRVEIIVGKNVEVDQVNRHFLDGTLTEVVIEGWGFPKYVVQSKGRVGGTLIGVPPGAKNVTKFVTLRNQRQLFRYNSRLPVVVYTPAGFIVRFRVWRPDNVVMDGRPG